MKEMDGVTYYGVEEFNDLGFSREAGRDFSVDDLRGLLEREEMVGVMMDGTWYADAFCIQRYLDSLTEKGRALERRAVFLPTQALDLAGERLDGRILDIGGGGEGVIGRLAGERVVSIDRSGEELAEAPGDRYLKVVMDATDLKFLDGAFDTVTAFYSMLYMPSEIHGTVLSEIARVLKPGGEFVLWDAAIPNPGDTSKDVVVVPVQVRLDGATKITTSYGVKATPRDLAYYVAACGRAGLEREVVDVRGSAIRARFRKPR